MASFSTTRLPLCFQEEEYDPSIVSVGAGSPLALSPSHFCRSLLLLCVLHRPQQLSLSLCTLTRLALVSFTSPLLFSTPLISSCPPLFKVSAQALSQVLEGRNLAWFFRPVCWLCCGNCLLRGTQLCSALLSSSPDVNTQPRLLLALKESLKHLVAMITAEPTRSSSYRRIFFQFNRIIIRKILLFYSNVNVSFLFFVYNLISCS